MPTPGFASPEASSPRRCRPGGAMKLKGQGCLLDITNSPVTASTTPLGTKVWGPGSKAPAGPGRAEEPAFITDETFDFDFVLSPTSQERGDEGDVEEEEDDDDEVFFGPMGHREKCIMVGKGLQQQDLGPEPHWSPLTGDKFVQVCKEATLLALHMEKACVAGEAPAAGHVSRSSRSKARARVVERFVEESCSKLKLLEAVRAPAQPRTPRQETSLPRGPAPGIGDCPDSDRRVAGDGEEGEVSGAGLESERPQPQPSTNATRVGAQQLPSCTSAVMATQASDDDGGEERPLVSCPVLEDDTLDAPASSSLLLPSRTKLRRALGLRPPAPVGGTRPPPGQQKISSSSSSGSCSSLLGLGSSHRASPRGSSTASAATGGRRLQGVLRPPTGHPVQPGGLPRPLSLSGQQAPASRSHPARASALPSRRAGSASDGSVIPGGKRVPSTGQLAQRRSDRGGGRAAAGGEGRGTPVPPSGTGDAARAVGMGSARHPATPSKEGRESAAALSGDVASGETWGVCRAGKPRGVAAGGKPSEAGTPVKLLRGQRLSALGSTDRPPAVFVTPSKPPPRSTIPTPVVGSRGGAVVPPGSTPASVTRRRSCIPAITPIRTPASLRPRRDPDGIVAAAAIAMRADAEGETADTQAPSQLLFSPPATDSLHATTRGGGRPCSCRRSPRTGASAGAPLIPVEASSSIISLSPDSDVPLQNVVVNLFGSVAALEQLESLLPAETFASQGDASGDLLCGFAAEKSTQAEERPLIDLSDSPDARDGGGGGSGNSKELIDLSSPLINLGQRSSAECLLINIDSPLLKF
ncbi:uncharacterized protein LOC116947584 isoform X1 [Petromyzon marinus]|uniref:uncharacterized protein LOC116947584 isoform X1 n=2 Tax=Petromyzon marinus TaxID=7757 RepID=UPI003F6FF39E